MMDILAIAFFKQPVQIGQFTFPIGLMLLLVGCFAGVAGLNGLYLYRYRRVMDYLERRHPETYEQVRRKPDIGPLYSKAYNPSKALIALAQRSATLNDPQLEKMLFDFVQFDRKFVLFSSVAIGVMLILVMVVSLVLRA